MFTSNETAKILGISKETLYRYLKNEKYASINDLVKRSDSNFRNFTVEQILSIAKIRQETGINNKFYLSDVEKRLGGYVLGKLIVGEAKNTGAFDYTLLLNDLKNKYGLEELINQYI